MWTCRWPRTLLADPRPVALLAMTSNVLLAAEWTCNYGTGGCGKPRSASPLLQIEMPQSDSALVMENVREDHSACEDRPDFVDVRGHPCTAWEGYNCKSYYGYNSEQLAAVQLNCPRSCGVPPCEKNSSPVYLVGNGVLSDDDRKILQNVPRSQIYRFNGMTNLRAGEPVGNVFARNNFDSFNGGYWGVSCCESAVTAKERKDVCGGILGPRSNAMCVRLPEAEKVILLGGAHSKAEAFNRSCHNTIKLLEHFTDGMVNLTDANGGFSIRIDGKKVKAPKNFISGFSSGLLAFAYLRDRLPNSRIHIMGMNWASSVLFPPHPFQLEEDIIRESVSFGKTVVHETPSNAYHYHNKDVCECPAQIVSLLQQGQASTIWVKGGACLHGGRVITS